MSIELMDTTLRDGEQTSGIAFSYSEKLHIAKLLIEELNVDRIEIASARVSEGEFTAVKKIMEWAAKKDYLDRIEVLGFVDGKISIDWMNKAGAKVLNLLCKGSLRHLEGQLKKTREQHVADIIQSINYARKLNIQVNIYLEDWSNGMKSSPEYVFYLMEQLKNQPVKRFMLPDTLGILTPTETGDFCKSMIDRYPEVHFDFHAHNDYDMAVANVLAAVKVGIKGIHTTVNGLGERAGNAPLSSVLAVIKDLAGKEININEKKITMVSKLVESFSGIRIPANKPVIGENVFTQTSGVHADGDNKNNLYYNDLLPERFGRVRKYALGKTAGKSNIIKNLEEMGISLDPESMKKVTQRVIELGDMKEKVTAEDLPYIISDVLGNEVIKSKIKIHHYSLSTVNGLKPVATVAIEINKILYEDTAQGDGQYDAFMNVIKKVYSHIDRKIPKLVDYMVTIPPGGKTDALVETVITWKNGREFKTRGLDSDQNIAAIKATIKMLNRIENDAE
jgi:(R)-citramalate synthase